MKNKKIYLVIVLLLFNNTIFSMNYYNLFVNFYTIIKNYYTIAKNNEFKSKIILILSGAIYKKHKNKLSKENIYELISEIKNDKNNIYKIEENKYEFHNNNINFIERKVDNYFCEYSYKFELKNKNKEKLNIEKIYKFFLLYKEIKSLIYLIKINRDSIELYYKNEITNFLLNEFSENKKEKINNELDGFDNFKDLKDLKDLYFTDKKLFNKKFDECFLEFFKKISLLEEKIEEALIELFIKN